MSSFGFCSLLAGMLVTLSLSATGCYQTSSPDPQDNLRNNLLEKLQGQAREEKLQIVLKIVQSDSNEAVRLDALKYVCGLGIDAAPLGEPLVDQLLIESNPRIVLGLTEAIVQSQLDVETYMTAKAVNADAVQLTRIYKVLGHLSAPKPETVDFLIDQLSTANQSQFEAVCKALEDIGPAAKSALPKLVELAARPRESSDGRDGDERVYQENRNTHGSVIRAIAAIGADASAIDILTSTLSMEPQIARFAAEALGSIGPAAATALPELEALYARDDHDGKDVKTRQAREAAGKAIAAIQMQSES